MYQQHATMRAPRVYRYVVMHDEGLAPNIEGGFCTLVCCKPMIRRTAQAGDWVFGFASKRRAPAGLVYAMQVEEVLPMESYFTDERFTGRRDRIYVLNGNGDLAWRRNAFNDHPEPADWSRDIGGRNALVATDWWYFGDDHLDPQPRMPDVQIGRWRAQRGHRVNGLIDEDLSEMLTLLPSSAWRRQRLRDGNQGNCGGCSDPAPRKRQQVAGYGSRSSC